MSTVLAASIFASGCASLDPTGDIAQASSLVGSRSGVDAGWERPWYETAEEEWDGQSPLSSDVAVRLALRNNRAIRRDVESVAASRADFVQAHLLPNPVINFAYGFPSDGLGGAPLALSVVQQLSWLWKRPVAIDEAEAHLRSRILAISDSALRLVARVRQTHAEVVYAEQAVSIQGESIELVGRSRDLLHFRFDVGEASRLDVNRIELDLEQERIRLEVRETALDVARRRLLELVGRAEAGAAWTSDGIVPANVNSIDDLNESDVMELAGAQRLDVAAANATVEGRLANVELARRGQLLDIGAGVGYQENFSGRTGVFPTVSVTPKLFDDNSARIAAAASALRQAEIEADRVWQSAVTETRQAFVTMRSRHSIAMSYEGSIIELASSNVILARDAFDAGEADLTVLLEAQRQLNAARLELIDRRYETARAMIELERATGGTLVALPPLAAPMSSERLLILRDDGGSGEATP